MNGCEQSTGITACAGSMCKSKSDVQWRIARQAYSALRLTWNASIVAFSPYFSKNQACVFGSQQYRPWSPPLNATEYDTIQPFYLPSYCTRPLQNCLHGRIAALCATRRLAYLIDMYCLLPCKGPNLLKKTKGFRSGY